jgi:hypothetical protein
VAIEIAAGCVQVVRGRVARSVLIARARGQAGHQSEQQQQRPERLESEPESIKHRSSSRDLASSGQPPLANTARLLLLSAMEGCKVYRDFSESPDLCCKLKAAQTRWLIALYRGCNLSFQ